MMYQVPTPLPGEHAMSIIYRWFQMSRYPTLESFISFHEKKSKFDSPRRLWLPIYMHLADALSPFYSLPDFVRKFTSVTDYSLFLDESVFEGENVGAILINLSAFKFNYALNISQDKHWRYCPVCALEDEEKYGTSYLHVAHQRFYKRVCSKHDVLLEKINPFNFSLPPTCSEPVIATQSDIDKDVALSNWVTDLKGLPIDERKIRIFSLLHQKICIYSYNPKNRRHVQRILYMQNILAKRFNRSVYPYYFEWGKLSSWHYLMNSTCGLINFLKPQKHFHPMIYLMLIDLFLKRNELDISMEYRLNMSNVRRELPPVVAPLDISELEQDSAV